ncbi:MAG: hypothetical protein K2N71_04300 [Oscillospiraceae bacterium]|nr:hypothetical protein [Oscillospiraceae bacterium]
MNLSLNLNKIGYSSAVKALGKKSAKKKDISEGLNEKSIKKMEQLAYSDAIKGKRSHEAAIFMNQCREKVAPDREKIFVNAQKGMSAEIERFKDPTNIWVYLLDVDEKFDGGSYKGNYTRTGNHIFIDAYDESGEKVGIYDSNYGWRIKHTSAEKQVMAALANVYNETFNKVYKEVHRNKSKPEIPSEIQANLDVRA